MLFFGWMFLMGGGELMAVGGDFEPDKVFGKSDLTESVPNQVVGNRVFHPAGVVVDRSVRPNRVYVWDSGNSRMLGFDSLGKCPGGRKCTTDSDCPGFSCEVEPKKKADIIIGQPDEFKASCNGNNNQVTMPTEKTLCSEIYPYNISLMESPEPMRQAVDSKGNLYIFDKFNNRVLKYNDPFKTDTVADAVWGQADFYHRGLNRTGDPVGAVVNGIWPNEGKMANNTLSGGVGGGDNTGGGIEVDSEGNLWVADLGNGRVLRFPFDPSSGEPRKEADLVLGQKSFEKKERNACLSNFNEQVVKPFSGGNSTSGFDWYRYPPRDYMCRPKSVSRDPKTGKLYVIDWSDGEGVSRVMIFNPPFSIGMEASEVIHASWLTSAYGYRMRRPTGIEVDFTEDEAFWITAGEYRVLHYKKTDGRWIVDKVIGQPNLTMTGGGNNCRCGDGICRVDGSGGIGLDTDGNVYLGDLDMQQVVKFRGPVPGGETLGGRCYREETVFLKNDKGGNHSANLISAYGVRDPGGMAVAEYSDGQKQLLVIDRERVLFWNNYTEKTSGAAADGVLFQPDFETMGPSGGTIGAITTDGMGRIWIAKGDEIWVYQGPLVSRKEKTWVIPRRLPIRGGGVLTLGNEWIAGLAYDERNNVLWIADTFNHRVVRVNCPLNGGCTRQVDMVLGQSNNEPHEGTTEQWPNRGRDDPRQNPPICANITADSMTYPGKVYLDRQDNLYIVDGHFEGWACSNNRLLEYDAADLVPDPVKVFFGDGEKGAKRVYGSSGFVKEEKNVYVDNVARTKPVTPISVTFTERNQMVMTVDGYGNDFGKRVFWYENPVPECVGRCRVEPDGIRSIAGGQMGSAWWDGGGNLLILDQTWNRVLWLEKPTGSAGCGSCQNGKEGDADCDGKTDLNDFMRWKEGFIRGGNGKADFNCDGKTDLVDFAVWKRGYLK